MQPYEIHHIVRHYTKWHLIFTGMNVYSCLVPFQLFLTALGHTEGDLEPVYTMVTTRGLYLLTCYGRSGSGLPNANTRFQKHSHVKYTELDYISVKLLSEIMLSCN